MINSMVRPVVRWRAMVTRVVVALLVAAAIAVAGAGGRQEAFADPGVRVGNAQSELVALNQHGLGRAPDASGLKTYGDLIAQDCTWGMLVATYSIATSPEATNGLLRGANDKTNFLYIGALGRSPDVDGWNAHHNSLLNGRSWEKVLTSVMSSPEYRQRVSSICAGAPAPTEIVINMGETNTATAEALIKHAVPSGVSCAAMKVVIAGTGKVTINGLPLGKAAQVAAKVTAQQSGANTQCSYAANLVAAGAYGAVLGSDGETVFYRSTSSLDGCTLNYRYDVGRTPVDVQAFSGQYKLPAIACVMEHRRRG